jgi:hypothetical protein
MLTICIAKFARFAVIFEHESQSEFFCLLCFLCSILQFRQPSTRFRSRKQYSCNFRNSYSFFLCLQPRLFDSSKNISVRSCSHRHSCKFARFVVLFLSTSKSDILAKTEAKNFKNLSVHANIFCVDGEKYTVSTQKLLVRANFLCVEEKQRGCFRCVYLGARWPTTAPPAQKSVLCLFAKTCLVIDIYAERTEICVRIFAQIDIFAE